MKMPNMNSNFADTYQTISNNFLKCEAPLMEVVEAINASPCIIKEKKKVLLDKVQKLFKDANSILNELGKLGQVK